MIRAKKTLGQHFLTDKNIVRKIVDAVDPQPEDLILEIGPGMGALTEALVQTQARIIAVDVDPRAVDFLRTRVENENWSDIRIVHEDILKTDITSICETGKVKVAGNLPYNITSPILFRLFEQHQAVASAVCMMQLEVAQRICSGPGTKAYGILSVQTRIHAEPKLLFRVSPHVFKPEPDVWSAVVRFDFEKNRLAEVDDIAFMRQVVKAAFGVRRKTLNNALKRAGLLPEQPPEGLIPFLSKRAEQLSVTEFIEMTSLIQSR